MRQGRGERLHGGLGSRGIDVVEDEEPVGGFPQPSEHGGDLGVGIGGGVFRQVEDGRGAESGEVAAQGIGRVRRDKEQGPEVRRVPPGVFDGGPGLALRGRSISRMSEMNEVRSRATMTGRVQGVNLPDGSGSAGALATRKRMVRWSRRAARSWSVALRWTSRIFSEVAFAVIWKPMRLPESMRSVAAALGSRVLRLIRRWP